ncbi:MAG: hypothetical protein QGI78_08805, partial [Phycisphaerales bacterium]|nr:hypothetical protein [Phycisphaerales bacterium]
PDPDFGACCYQDADLGMMCVFIDGANCANVGGTWYSGVTCECAPVCEPPTGACCYMNESGEMLCVITESAPCLTLPNSTFYGVGTTCANVVCCAPVGGCCIKGTCLLASQDQCDSANGEWQGIGVICPNVECYFCLADFNDNGAVDINDLLQLLAAMGVCP